MPMQAVQVRLSDAKLKWIDKQVAKGHYPSRSEGLRDYLRKAQLWEMLEKVLELGDIDAPEAALDRQLARVRERVYRKLTGAKAK